MIHAGGQQEKGSRIQACWLPARGRIQDPSKQPCEQASDSAAPHHAWLLAASSAAPHHDDTWLLAGPSLSCATL